MEQYSPEEKSLYWDRFIEIIRDSVNTQSFNTWFKPISLIGISDSLITISVPKPYFSSWLEEHYLPLIRSASSAVFGKEMSFSFVPVEVEQQVLISDYPVSPPEPHPHRKNLTGIEPLMINNRFTFDSFVVGNTNQFAHAAAKAVAKSPGTTAFNPLVIYGGVGLGKTHLLQAIALHCIASNRFKDTNKIIYISSEKFTMDFIMSIQNNITNEFTRYYRNAHILLVDDIQFLNNKERTQEEFFHLFNTLHQQGKQIVLSMDNPPNNLKGLADRLINRFQWGLVTDIQPPDFETRVAILNKKAAADSVYLDPAIPEFIAKHITTNIRELEGSLIRLLAYSSLYGRDISLEMAREVLGDTIRKRPPLITIEFIQKLVSEHFSLPPNSLMSNSRRKEIAVARHISIYLAKQLTDSSLKTIGLHFGGRDHSTVIHSLKKAERIMSKDSSIANHVETLIQKAKNSQV